MLILHDAKMPARAIEKLGEYGDTIGFATVGITYEAISGHTDIFFCPTPSGLIVAPNLPEEFFGLLQEHSIPFSTGYLPVGTIYPASATYNTLVAGKFIIGNPAIHDKSIVKLNEDLNIIPVRQGYVRCNLLPLPGDRFITSDRGIEKSLIKHNLEVLFVDSSCIKLEGFDHGFFGGACGLLGNTLFLCGSLEYFSEKDAITGFLAKSRVSLVELYDGPPMDVGTILLLSD